MDKWSEIKIFEGYSDSDSTYLYIKLFGMPNDLKMNKIQFHNYPQVIDKIRMLAPYQAIRYRTTLHTHSGAWKVDEWFSDIEPDYEDHSEETARALKEALAIAKEKLRFQIGARIHVEIYGNGIIENVETIGTYTVLTINFDNYVGMDNYVMKKTLNLDEMKIVDSTD